MTWRAGFATRVPGTSTTFTEFHSLGYFADFAAGTQFAVRLFILQELTVELIVGFEMFVQVYYHRQLITMVEQLISEQLTHML